MADEANRIQQRLQNSVNEMMTTVRQRVLRPLTKASYLKMAACCDLAQDDAMDSCMQRNSGPMQIAQQIIENEMSQFQNRVQRCAQECNDSARDSVGVNADTSDPRVQERFMNYGNKCLNACVDKHVALLKGIQQRIEKDVNEKAKAR
jgi:hypothetical protein